jgi:processive 1,2-diacylglycerol beta-glucosyltransferase
MTKILILHASLGSGHVSAANAIAEVLSRQGVEEVRVEDGLDYADAAVRTIITKGYLRVSEQSPLLWRKIYEGTDKEDFADTLESNKLMGEFQRPFYKKLEKLILEMEPDAIISTQQFPLLIVQALKQTRRISQPNYVVITDFMAHSSWINEGVACYFVASEFTRDALIWWGVPEDKLRVTGIPVKVDIAEQKAMAEMRIKLDLPLNKPVVTLFGGGIMPERVKRIVSIMLDSPIPAVIVTVSGRNKQMSEALADLSDSPTIRLRKYEYIDFVDDLVAASDLVVTKSGGLIVSEVLARGTPMVIVDPIPGQEEWNADFVVGAGAGLQMRLPEMVPAAVVELLSDQGRLTTLRDQAKKYGRPRAAWEIADFILEDIK